MEVILEKGAAIFALAVVSTVAPAAAMPSHSMPQGSTVNSYTPAQEANARNAATKAGFVPGPVLFAQAGNFFFNADKDDRSYALTVTPDGHVYASTSTN